MKSPEKRKQPASRDMLAELVEEFGALADARRGKRTLRTHSMEFRCVPTLTPTQLVRIRQKRGVKRPVRRLPPNQYSDSGALRAGESETERAGDTAHPSRAEVSGYDR